MVMHLPACWHVYANALVHALPCICTSHNHLALCSLFLQSGLVRGTGRGASPGGMSTVTCLAMMRTGRWPACRSRAGSTISSRRTWIACIKRAGHRMFWSCMVQRMSAPLVQGYCLHASHGRRGPGVFVRTCGWWVGVEGGGLWACVPWGGGGGGGGPKGQAYYLAICTSTLGSHSIFMVQTLRGTHIMFMLKCMCWQQGHMLEVWGPHGPLRLPGAAGSCQP